MTQPWKIDLPLLALIVANLVPLLGVLYLQWDVGAIVALYWVENLIIGGYTLLKMLVAGGVSALGRMLFFCVHYGFFCAIHGMFVLELTKYAGEISTKPETLDGSGPLLLLHKLDNFVQQILATVPEEFVWACIALLLSHGASFLLLFVIQGDYRKTTVKALMSAPYRRIAILHVAIIAGGFFVIELGQPLGLLLALVAVKIVMDIMLHRRAHRQQTGSGINSNMEDDYSYHDQ